MRKYIALALCAITIIAVLLAGCKFHVSDPNYTPPEQPVRYYKEIDVVVTGVYYRRWFAGTLRHEVTVRVESVEYGISGSFSFRGSGYFSATKQASYKEGDVIKAELYSLVMNSTGEIVERRINRIY